MNHILNVHLLPDLAHPHELAGNTAIVIDVLRASTTITTAIANGAASIIPCLTVEEARELAGKRPGALLGGERAGKKLPGFDFGNSPLDYPTDRVAGKTIVFTTTNGTKAMTRCMGSSRILIGSIVNRTAVCQAAAEDSCIDILCAGTDGKISLDDALAAGSIASGLTEGRQLNDSAQLCRSLWEQLVSRGQTAQGICETFAKSLGGKNLIAIGMEADLALAAEVDRFAIVPELDRSCWEISISSQ